MVKLKEIKNNNLTTITDLLYPADTPVIIADIPHPVSISVSPPKDYFFGKIKRNKK